MTAGTAGTGIGPGQKSLLERYSEKTFIYLVLFLINQFPLCQTIYSLSSHGALVFIDWVS